jgi:hypothetical protein
MVAVPLPQIIAPPHQYRKAKIALLLVLFLGLISFVVSRESKLDCANEYWTGAGLNLTGGGKALPTGRHQYWLVIEDERVPLPSWTQSIMNKLGLMSSKCR